MPGGSPVRRTDPPYFFFSYHRSAYRPNESFDADRWAKKLFSDLCLNIYNLTDASNPGFMDVEMPLAREWPDALADALACCRVFVPVLRPGYFTSEFCGKEWAAFSQRAKMHAGQDSAHAAMVPLLWSRYQLNELPPQVAKLNLIPPGFPPLYPEGFYALMKLRRYRGAYEDSVWQMAKMIKDTAESTKLPPCARMDLSTVTNAFTEYQATEVTRQVRVVVAARPAGEGRSPYYYGRTMLEWAPYRGSADSVPITQHADEIISGLGYHAVIAAIDEAEPAPGPGQSVSVLLVDPWAAGIPWIRDKLRAIDNRPVHVLVPWNDEDEETAREASRLTEDLRAALPKSLLLNGSSAHVPTLDTFLALLPDAVNEAIVTYFRRAQAYPPTEPPSMRLPNLEGPEA